MGDCLAVVNLAEVSRMDYNCDVTELTINPRIPYFFFSFVLFFWGGGEDFNSWFFLLLLLLLLLFPFFSLLEKGSFRMFGDGE